MDKFFSNKLFLPHVAALLSVALIAPPTGSYGFPRASRADVNLHFDITGADEPAFPDLAIAIPVTSAARCDHEGNLYQLRINISPGLPAVTKGSLLTTTSPKFVPDGFTTAGDLTQQSRSWKRVMNDATIILT